ncbi:STAS domain-containing protein [Zavarzinella formosa]|uniref:STAS domain-containing protein n=1 Tax=Zavarzinella formosa TaxID=360055 RepID=UPI0002EB7F86|nr:STAS domain-containing protein [Zavarzinella formosa]
MFDSVLRDDYQNILNEWLAELQSAKSGSDHRLGVTELRSQGETFLSLLRDASKKGQLASGQGDSWLALQEFLERISSSRAVQGFTSSETAGFVFSLKKFLFAAMRRTSGANAEALAAETWKVTELLDKLGLLTVTTYQKAREDVIRRQQEELLELSTPVVKLWDGVLALPMIGTLDSARTQVVMEALLQRLVETESEIAIIDITGVPTVDTLVAQHLLKTVTAIRLMGADCIISGIRPQIAQTIVHLGVDLQGVTTKANLADALSLALKRLGLTVGKVKQ